MKKIILKNQLEYYIALAIEGGSRTINGVCSILSTYSKESIASAFASMHNRMLVDINENGFVKINSTALKAYHLIGNGIDASSYSGSTKGEEIVKYVQKNVNSKDEDIYDVLSCFTYRIVVSRDE